MRPSHQGATRQSPHAAFTLQSLEPRLLLSHVAVATSGTHSAPWAAPAAASDPAAASLTVDDRRQLIAHLTPGPLTASLSKSLKYSGPAAFDATLLKYMI